MLSGLFAAMPFASFFLARLRHADRTERCPLSGVTRKTSAHAEFVRKPPMKERA